MPKPNSGPPFVSAQNPARTGHGPVIQFAVLAIAGLVLVVGVTRFLSGTSLPSMVLALAGYGFGVVLALVLLRRGFPHPTLGSCNVVTLTRLCLSAALLAPLGGQTGASWTVFVIAAVALSLDGADGWLARRGGRVSDFGARFDMEVDSGLALILAVNAWAAGTAGALVLLIGLPRYVFVAASGAMPWLDRPLPDRFSRKAVCVLQIGTLIALQLPVISGGLVTTLVAVAATALLWSFWCDVAWLRRHRG